MRTVIFDLDGTLADTSGDLIAAANACFRGLGHGDLLDARRDAAIALRGGRAMLLEGFGRIGRGEDLIEVDRQYPRLLELYAEAIDTHSYLYAGAVEAVEELGAAGYKLGICTNKPEALADLLLRRLGVRELFASLIGADTLEMRKPHPEPLREAVRRAGGDPARAILIGDTITDRDTARAAGVPSVLVTFGPGREDVLALSPEATIERFADLPGVVRQLIG